MYIISKKKDYYDGVAGTTGIDKAIVYDRQIVELEEKNIPKIFQHKKYLYSKHIETPFAKLFRSQLKKKYRLIYPGKLYQRYHGQSHFIIGFCGKFYVGWKLYSTGRPLSYGGHELITTITYDFNFMKEMMEPSFWGENFEDDVNYIRNYSSIDEWRFLNAPAFVYDSDYNKTKLDEWKKESKFIVNPLLKEYEFYKIFDAVQAFQEIQMFLSGVLGNKEKEIVNVADKYKITQHGFDKWSFRKEPEKNK